jgi:hypothetical protein
MATKKQAAKTVQTDSDAKAPAGKEWYDDGGNEGLVLRDIPEDAELDEDEEEEEDEDE